MLIAPKSTILIRGWYYDIVIESFLKHFNHCVFFSTSPDFLSGNYYRYSILICTMVWHFDLLWKITTLWIMRHRHWLLWLGHWAYWCVSNVQIESIFSWINFVIAVPFLSYSIARIRVFENYLVLYRHSHISGGGAQLDQIQKWGLLDQADLQ